MNEHVRPFRVEVQCGDNSFQSIDLQSKPPLLSIVYARAVRQLRATLFHFHSAPAPLKYLPRVVTTMIHCANECARKWGGEEE